jgi:hypothetical protein
MSAHRKLPLQELEGRTESLMERWIKDLTILKYLPGGLEAPYYETGMAKPGVVLLKDVAVVLD